MSNMLSLWIFYIFLQISQAISVSHLKRWLVAFCKGTYPQTVRRHFITRSCYPQVQLRTSALADSLRLGTQSVGCPCLAELKSHVSTATVIDRSNTSCLVYPSLATLKHADSSAYISTCITAQKMEAHEAYIFSPHLSVLLFFSPSQFSALLCSLPPWTVVLRM